MEEDTSRNFKFINFGSELEIYIDENNQAQCPKCKKNPSNCCSTLKRVQSAEVS